MKKLFYILIPVVILVASVFLYRFLPSCPFCHSREGGNPDAQAAASRTGLVGHWTMDANDANGTNYWDRSGNNKTAVSAGGPPVVAGKINQAASLNGASQYFTVADNSSLFAPTLISISTWFKISQTTNNNIVSKNASYYLGLGSGGVTAGKVGFYIDGVNSSYTVTNMTLSDGQWHHFIVTWDGTYEKLYVDGILDKTSGVLAGSIPVNTNALLIGYRAGDFVMNGSIDDVRIYNRALSAQEVANLYSSAKTNYIASAPIVASSTPDRRLVGWWTMDANDINGTAVYDKSGQNLIGAITGTPIRVAGKINQAMLFGGVGSGQYISGTANATLQSTGAIANSVTVSAWVTNNDFVNYLAVFTTQAWSFGKTNASKITFRTSDGAAADTPAANTVIPSGWHFIAATKSGSAITFYLDGVPDGTATQTKTTAITSWAISNGVFMPPAGNDIWSGNIDDVRIYNYALTAAEIGNLYSSAKTNYVASAPLIGLVGHWTMDSGDYASVPKTLFDKSGNRNNGTSINAASFVAGKVNQAMVFNGISDYVSIASNENLKTSSALTLSVWIKQSEVNTNDGVLYKGGFGGAHGDYQLDLASGVIQFVVNGYTHGTQTSAILSVGRWYNVTAISTGSSMLIYVDGVLVSSSCFVGTCNPASLTTSNNNLIIGGYFSPSFLFAGSIDDVRIYNRALSAQEVANLYQSAKKNYVQ